MRLGGPIYQRFDDPDQWIRAVQAKGYTAAYCPIDETADGATLAAYIAAAAKADVVIGEVGAWCNPLDTDPDRRRQAVAKCVAKLDFADRIGAACCVNIAGSLGEKWDGPSEKDLTDEAFDLTVESVRTIIDTAKPSRACYTLEPMPWMYPECPDDYLRLIKAIDRERFGVHLDPVNMINSPPRFLHNGRFVRECFEKLGPWMKAVHIKDVRLNPGFTALLEEVRPGLGKLDYAVLLTEASRLSEDLPLLLEHLQNEEEYDAAAGYVREQAARCGLRFR